MIFGGTWSQLLTFSDCIINTKIMNESNIRHATYKSGQNTGWAVENAMKINLGKSKAVSFMTTQVKDPLFIFLGTKEFWKRAAANI